MTVKIVIHALEIDIGRVDAAGKRHQRIVAEKAVGYQNCLHAPGFGLACGVIDLFDIDRRLVIGKGHAWGPVFFCQARKAFWTDTFAGNDAFGRNGRDIVVLAKFAAKITARAAYGKCFCARQKMIKGLFFDGIHIHGRNQIAHQGS